MLGGKPIADRNDTKPGQSRKRHILSNRSSIFVEAAPMKV